MLFPRQEGPPLRWHDDALFFFVFLLARPRGRHHHLPPPPHHPHSFTFSSKLLEERSAVPPGLAVLCAQPLLLLRSVRVHSDARDLVEPYHDDDGLCTLCRRCVDEREEKNIYCGCRQ